MLEEAARFTESEIAPLNAVGDAHGCVYDKATGDVTTPPGFREAYLAFADAGWAGLTGPESAGGQDMPESLGAAVKEMLDAARNLEFEKAAELRDRLFQVKEAMFGVSLPVET